MSMLDTALAMNAASNASDAAAAAKKAQSASEESLEGKSFNPFISFAVLSLEKVPQQGLFTADKEQLGTETTSVSVKKTDIAFVAEGEDDFGTKFSKVFLEERCNINQKYLRVTGTVEEVSNYINSK